MRASFTSVCLAICASLAWAPASAAEPTAVEDLAYRAAHEQCPRLLASRDLNIATDGGLKGLGFGNAKEVQEPKFGLMRQVVAAFPDGAVAFGGVPGGFCQVMVAGPRSPQALAKLKSVPGIFGLQFVPDEANSGTRASNIKLETSKAQLAPGKTLYVQIMSRDAGEQSLAGYQVSGIQN